MNGLRCAAIGSVPVIALSPMAAAAVIAVLGGPSLAVLKYFIGHW
ncbi:hypothetical protein HNP40_001221 [Mycobacteroides chelonae]|nr:hypothetical protein [Mycobacteroides chelonae]